SCRTSSGDTPRRGTAAPSTQRRKAAETEISSIAPLRLCVFALNFTCRRSGLGLGHGLGLGSRFREEAVEGYEEAVWFDWLVEAREAAQALGEDTGVAVAADEDERH